LKDGLYADVGRDLYERASIRLLAFVFSVPFVGLLMTTLTLLVLIIELQVQERFKPALVSRPRIEECQCQLSLSHLLLSKLNHHY